MDFIQTNHKVKENRKASLPEISTTITTTTNGNATSRKLKQIDDKKQIYKFKTSFKNTIYDVFKNRGWQQT